MDTPDVAAETFAASVVIPIAAASIAAVQRFNIFLIFICITPLFFAKKKEPNFRLFSLLIQLFLVLRKKPYCRAVKAYIKLNIACIFEGIIAAVYLPPVEQSVVYDVQAVFSRFTDYAADLFFIFCMIYQPLAV